MNGRRLEYQNVRISEWGIIECLYAFSTVEREINTRKRLMAAKVIKPIFSAFRKSGTKYLENEWGESVTTAFVRKVYDFLDILVEFSEIVTIEN